MARISGALLTGLGILAASTSANADVVSARRVVGQGDPLSGELTYGSAMFAKRGTDGSLAVFSRPSPGSESVLAIDHEPVWSSADWADVPWNVADSAWDWEAGAAGDFLLRPATTPDQLYGPSGLLLAVGDPMPLFPGGTVGDILGVRVRPDGSVSMSLEFDSNGSGGDDRVAIIAFDDTSLSNPSVVIEDGVPVGDRTLDWVSIHHISDNGQHSIIDGSSGTISILIVDGEPVAIEQDPAGGAGNHTWGEMSGSVAINNSGQYVFSGYAWNWGDALLAVDGDVVLSESDTIDGVELAPSTSPIAQLTNAGLMVHMWDDRLFYSCDAANAASDSLLIAQRGDEVDFDGDGIADGGIDDIDGFDLSEDGEVLITGRISVPDGFWPDTVYSVEVSCCGNGFVEGDEACDGTADCNDACEIEDAGETSGGTGSDPTGDEGSSTGGDDDGDSADGGGAESSGTGGQGASAGGTTTASTGGDDSVDSDTDVGGSQDGASGGGCHVGGGKPALALGLLVLLGLRRRC